MGKGQKTQAFDHFEYTDWRLSGAPLNLAYQGFPLWKQPKTWNKKLNNSFCLWHESNRVLERDVWQTKTQKDLRGTWREETKKNAKTQNEAIITCRLYPKEYNHILNNNSNNIMKRKKTKTRRSMVISTPTATKINKNPNNDIHKST